MIPVQAVIKDLPPMKPPVSVIVPYDQGIGMNPIHVCRNDEVIFVLNGTSIGRKRIEGVKRASNDWTVNIDADGTYPKEFIPQVKEAINHYGADHQVMMGVRQGGLMPPSTLLESGLIARKDAFLEKTSTYREERGFWTDVVKWLSDDYIIVPAFYYHPPSKDEVLSLKALLNLYSAVNLTRNLAVAFSGT